MSRGIYDGVPSGGIVPLSSCLEEATEGRNTERWVVGMTRKDAGPGSGIVKQVLFYLIACLLIY